MRLFTAILLEEEVKSSIMKAMDMLKQNAIHGSFTHKENLHLTVNFIGETKRLTEVKEAMRSAVEITKPGIMQLQLQGFGRFKRSEGDIYWVGINKNEALWRLQRQLVKELKEVGFYDLDDREYKPHLTMGRRIEVGKQFDPKDFEAGIALMKTEASRLSLMKSERLQGKLTYTEIYHVSL